MAFVVPVAGDSIKVVDNETPFKVTSYSNMKPEPAVYVDVPKGENNVVYFYDIEEINGVRVEYNRSAKLFDTLGLLKRKQNLPQPGDEISVAGQTPDGSPEDQKTVVKNVKLHNKLEGISRGLVVCDVNTCYDLTQIKQIDRKTGTEKFDAEKFQKYYFDYLPYSSKK
jgi:hypothetical protein